MRKTRTSNRTRILAVERLFQTKKPLTIQNIMDHLERNYDIYTDRKVLYGDIAELTMFMNIVTFRKELKYFYQLIDMNDPKAWEGTHTDREAKAWENPE